LPIALASALFAAVGVAQGLDSNGWESKLRIHAVRAYGPGALVRSAVSAGYLQLKDSPEEWGQGAEGYGKRLGSGLARSGIRNALGFSLDTALHQDPRYYRSEDTGAWQRVKHALRGTILTRTDSGSETFSTWRFGSAYGAAFLSNQWYPDRFNNTQEALTRGSTQIAFDLLGNITSEFWPDVKKKLLHRKP